MTMDYPPFPWQSEEPLVVGAVTFGSPSVCTGACRYSTGGCNCRPVYQEEPRWPQLERLFNPPPTQGWECPRCRKINAPTVQQCPCPAPSAGGPAVAAGGAP